MQSFRFFLYMVLVFITSSVYAQPIAIDDKSKFKLNNFEAINKAGRQRMLTQRIVKAYCMAGLDSNSEKYQLEVNDAVALFDMQLKQLEGVSKAIDYLEAIDKIKLLWGPFKQAALSEPNKDSLRLLVEANEELLHSADWLASLIEASVGVGGKYAQLLNIAGRQRMLSQRTAKFYVLQSCGFKSKSNLDNIQLAMAEFQSGLMKLIAVPDNTTMTSRELNAVAEQWMWLVGSLDVQHDTYFPLIVNDTAEKTLITMERLVSLYLQLAEEEIFQ